MELIDLGIDLGLALVGVIIAILIIGSSIENTQYCSTSPRSLSKYFLILLILILLGVGLAVYEGPENKEE
jgi:uncharacterized membrane protein YczE